MPLFDALPADVQALARKNFALLKSDSNIRHCTSSEFGTISGRCVSAASTVRSPSRALTASSGSGSARMRNTTSWFAEAGDGGGRVVAAGHAGGRGEGKGELHGAVFEELLERRAGGAPEIAAPMGGEEAGGGVSGSFPLPAAGAGDARTDRIVLSEPRSN